MGQDEIFNRVIRVGLSEKVTSEYNPKLTMEVAGKSISGIGDINSTRL